MSQYVLPSLSSSMLGENVVLPTLLTIKSMRDRSKMLACLIIPVHESRRGAHIDRNALVASSPISPHRNLQNQDKSC